MIAGLVIAFVIFGLFGLFGLGVWRMVDPAKWMERDTGQRPRQLSAWDQFRTVVWWAAIFGTIVIGIPAVVLYAADPRTEVVEALFAGTFVLGFLVAAIGSWTARCKTTGERVFLCHCPWHSGE